MMKIIDNWLERDSLWRVSSRGDHTWSTKDEITFIMQLGRHGNGSAYEPLMGRGEIVNRKVLLRKYLQAADNRADWGAMDKATCIAMAASLLASE